MQTRILTIMFTDLSDFTQKTAEMSREQIQEFLSSHDRVVRPILLARRGKIIKTLGDSFLAVFDSPTDAVLAGIQIQQAVEEYDRLVKPVQKMEIRVSINVGEVTEMDNDIFGDAVNVASRLLSIAEKNCVYFTEAVYLVMNKTEVPTTEIGYRQFKGVPEKIKVYRVLKEKPAQSSPAKKENLLPETIEPPKTEQEQIPEPKKKSHKILILLAALFLLGIGLYLSARFLHQTLPANPIPAPKKIAAVPQTAPTRKKVSSLPKSPHTPTSITLPKPVILKSTSPAAANPTPPKTAVISQEKPKFTTLEIDSSPSGFKVYINGKFMGRTDLEFPLLHGAYKLYLKKGNHVVKSVRLIVGHQKKLKENFNLSSGGNP